MSSQTDANVRLVQDNLDLKCEAEEKDARIAELEAALAERDARRCEGCDHVRHHAVGKPHAYRLCALGNSYGYDPALPDDFECNRWTARAEEGSGA